MANFWRHAHDRWIDDQQIYELPSASNIAMLIARSSSGPASRISMRLHAMIEFSSEPKRATTSQRGSVERGPALRAFG